MANLNTKTIAVGVTDILAVDGGVTGSGKNVKDGAGGLTPLWLTNTKVGIGESSPDFDLHIKNSSTNCILKIEASADGYDPKIMFTSTGAVDQWQFMMDESDANKMKFYDDVNNATRLTITQAGFVGIGTGSPDSLLHLLNNTEGAGTTLLTIEKEIDSSVEDRESVIRLGLDDTSANLSKAFDIIVSSAFAYGNLPIFSISRSDLAGKDDFVIDSDGKVGIGTAAPESLLHLSSTTAEKPTLVIEKTGAANHDGGNLHFRLKEDSGFVDAAKEMGDIQWQSYDTTGGDLGYHTSAMIRTITSGTHSNNVFGGEMQFWTNSGGASTGQRMVIDSAGQVGIGATAPNYPLEVVGTGSGGYVAHFDNSGTSSTSHGIRISAGDTEHGDSDTHYILFEESDGSDVGELDSDSGTLALSDTSDYRLKENINLISGGLAKVNALKPSTFNYKKYPNKVHEGFIAHEVVDAGIGYAIKGDKDAMKAKVTPAVKAVTAVEAVAAKDAVLDSDGNIVEAAIEAIEAVAAVVAVAEKTEQVDSNQLLAVTKIIPQMVSAIQELSAKVTALENA